MADRANHHFVPKFYFRQFSEDGARIQVLHKATSRIIANAPIKGQSTRRRLYGPPDIESLISGMEGAHSQAIRKTLRAAWDPDEPPIDGPRWFQLLQAVLVQRARTLREIEKFSDGSEKMLLEAFKQHLKTAPGIEGREEMVKEIEEGKVTLKQNDTWIVLEHLLLAIDSVILIGDLGIRLLRNYSGFPFIFGDAPVVLCNTYCRNVTSRGVLGLQAPGLQVFFPLDSETLLLLLDERTYTTSFPNRNILDITERSDVSQINALQLHHSMASVYFARERDSDYVASLWSAHKSSIVQSRSVFRIEEGWLLDNEPVDQIMHVFEPHLNLNLSLFFVHCDPIRASEFRPSYRSPELVEEHKRMLEVRDQQRKR